MGWPLDIGSIAGAAIRIHVTFMLFLAWIFGARRVGREVPIDGAPLRFGLVKVEP
jgi:hypothetical protein